MENIIIKVEKTKYDFTSYAENIKDIYVRA